MQNTIFYNVMSIQLNEIPLSWKKKIPWKKHCFSQKKKT